MLLQTHIYNKVYTLTQYGGYAGMKWLIYRYWKIDFVPLKGDTFIIVK